MVGDWWGIDIEFPFRPTGTGTTRLFASEDEPRKARACELAQLKWIPHAMSQNEMICIDLPIQQILFSRLYLI